MIAAGVIGADIIGFIQDKPVDAKIADYDKQHSTYVTEQKTSLFGDYEGLDQNMLATANQTDKKTVGTIRETAKKEALRYIVIFPPVMLVCYVLLIVYFKSKGEYKPVVLAKEEPDATPY